MKSWRSLENRKKKEVELQKQKEDLADEEMNQMLNAYQQKLNATKTERKTLEAQANEVSQKTKRINDREIAKAISTRCGSGIERQTIASASEGIMIQDDENTNCFSNVSILKYTEEFLPQFSYFLLIISREPLKTQGLQIIDRENHIRKTSTQGFATSLHAFIY